MLIECTYYLKEKKNSLCAIQGDKNAQIKNVYKTLRKKHAVNLCKTTCYKAISVTYSQCTTNT